MKRDSCPPSPPPVPLLSAACDMAASDSTSHDVDVEAYHAAGPDFKLDTDDPIVVSWDGPHDPENPKNWKAGRKWGITILVSCFTFISPFSSTMVTPAMDVIARDLQVPAGFMQQLVMTIFLLGFAQGPFVLAPLSEIFGRAIVLQLSNVMYLVFNLACGFAQTKEQMLAFRFLSGVGGSAPQAICNGILADCWRKEERGKGQAIYGLLTFLGPVLAPILGAYVSIYTTWRWIFWSTSAFDLVVQVAALFFLRETYGPRILLQKARRLTRETGRRHVTEENRPLSQVLRRRILVPFIMLFAHPAVQVPSLYRAYLYGVMYLVLHTFPLVWVGTYGMAKGPASLNYLSLGIGFIIGLQISHPLIDKLYAKFQTKYGHEDGLPEWRVPPMIIGAVLCPIGLFVYGWTAQAGAHWILPNIGCVILATGLIIAFQSAQAYVVDAYNEHYAASAAAAGAFVRTMFGFSFPLFAPKMYQALGLGWGNSLLAFTTIGIGVVSPGLLWFYGHKLREWSGMGMR
ncbi:MFS multidrug transporter, partial [Metarhizium hybridum]